MRATATGEERLGYCPELDGLRAVAILLVIAGHYLGWPRSSVFGVDLFFVLSGFLITVLLLEEYAAKGSISLKLFYLRRLLRLGPALAAFILVLAGLILIGALTGKSAAPPGVRVGLEELAFAATYTVNVALIWLPQHVAPPDVHVLWSLAVEEQFYLLWPLALVVLLRMRRTLVVPATVATLAILGIMLLRMTHAPTGPPGALDTAAVTRFDSILVGCLLGLVYRSGARRLARRAVSVPWVWAPALVVAAVLVATAGDRRFWNGTSTAFCIVVAIVVLSVVEGRTILGAALALPPLVFIGRISYPLYLWHLAVLVWLDRATVGEHLGTPATRILGIAITFACAVVSYRFVERPFLRLKWRLARTSSHDVPMAEALKEAKAEAAGALTG